MCRLGLGQLHPSHYMSLCAKAEWPKGIILKKGLVSWFKENSWKDMLSGATRGIVSFFAAHALKRWFDA
jgi:hypothetical protein